MVCPKHNLTIISSVQRLGDIFITGGLPSTPRTVLTIIIRIIPIDLVIEEEAAKGALRLKSNNHWIYEPMVNKSNLTTHTKLKKQLLKAINLNSEGKDQQTSSLNVDISPQKFLDSQSSECEVIENDTNTTQCEYGDKSSPDQSRNLAKRAQEQQHNSLRDIVN